MSIRFKVILPYLVLTLLVAITGAYVVTKLVTSSLSERLNNQLFEAGRVVQDGFNRQEIRHIESGRLIAYTRGVAQALKNRDWDQLEILVKPAAGGLDVEVLVISDPAGVEVLHLMSQDDRSLLDVGGQENPAYQSIVQSLVEANDIESLPRRMIARHPVNDHYYYFTALPIPLDEQQEGVIVIGTSFEDLLPHLKNTSLADVIFYADDGKVLDSTFGVGTADAEAAPPLAISRQAYAEIMASVETVSGENIYVADRGYSVARAPLQVGDDRLGVFAVALPTRFVLDASAVNRNTYILLFSIAMVLVILIGYGISRLIINPLSSLVMTSRAIAGGDLGQRTGIRSFDEIGILANSFDEMTENLQHRTVELERTNRILEAMDRTKLQFIHISAHELRTPLTLIQGYTQMIQFKAGNDPEMIKYASGILEGSHRMVEVIDSMLDVSRIDSNELNIAPAEVEIRPLIERVQRVFDNSMIERRLKFSTDGLDQLPTLYGDPELLYKVFYHLIMNAVQYTPNGGRITVRGRLVESTPGSPEIEIAVKDTGIGIDPQYHEAVFEKFFQVGEVLYHSSGKSKFKGGGPGLGLSIARGIVQAHNGRIWVESTSHDETRNPGSTFFVRLPLTGPGK